MEENQEKSLTERTVKNSFFNFSSNFIAKFGGFILSIVLARLLLPELFGIYSLILAVVILVFSFADLGIAETAIKYISESLGKNDKSKAASYFWFFFKIVSFLTIIITIILLLLSQTIAYDLFQKPKIFFPLLFAIFFMAVNSIRGFVGTLFYATNDLKQMPLVHTVLQGSKVIFTITALMIFSGLVAVSAVFTAFAASSLVTLILTIILLKRKKFNFSTKEKSNIDKKEISKYLGFMTAANISIIVFGYVDTFMLGRFVEAAYLGYYQVSFGLISSLLTVLGFSAVLLPVFTQIQGDRLKKGLSKSLRYISMISIPALVGLLFVSNYVISLFYGEEYLPGTIVLYALSFLFLVTPAVDLYSSLFKAKNKAKMLSLLMLITLILNIVLNYVLITNLLPLGQNFAILGAAAATTISRAFLLFVLTLKTKKHFKIGFPIKSIIKPIFATSIMASVLFVYNFYVDITLMTGILEVLLGISVYLLAMFLIKGINREDLNLIKHLLKRKAKPQPEETE